MRQYYTLADYPHAMIEIECDKCGRHGRLLGCSRSTDPIEPHTQLSTLSIDKFSINVTVICKSKARSALEEV